MEEKYGTEGNLMSRDLVAREIAMCPGQVYLENAKESIPVTPAIHFFMGGIKVDGMHQTNIAGLYAVGEAASKISWCKLPWWKFIDDSSSFGKNSSACGA